MPRSGGGIGIAGKAGYAVACVLAAVVLVVSGLAYYLKNQVASIGGSDVITGGPQTGAMNILLMGLESRTDYDGNILPADLLAAMHAGSVQGVENGVGGQDTNTLILIHIFAGGQKAVGFSIPRDDWVTFPQAVRRSVAGEDRPGLRPGLGAEPEPDRQFRDEPGTSATCWPTRLARRPRSPPSRR